MRRPKAQPAPPSVQPAAPPPDAVTSSEFRNALATIRAQHEGEVTRREEVYRATIHGLLKKLRDAEHAKQRAHVVDVSSEPVANPAAVAERMAAIRPLLEDHERHRWSSMVATMFPEDLARIQRELMTRTPEEGVAFLRSSLLSSAPHLPS